MKKIISILWLFTLITSVLSQSDKEFDILRANKELYIRGDTTILEFVEEHAPSSTARDAGNATELTGNEIGLGGGFTKNTDIEGNGYDLKVGLGSNKIRSFQLNASSQIGLYSQANIILLSQNRLWAIIGDYIINTSTGDTLSTLQEVTDLISENKAIQPFSFNYTYNSSIVNSRPGLGLFKLNNATLSNVTEIYIDYFDYETVDKSLYLSSADTGTYMTLQTDSDNWAFYQVIGYIDYGNYFSYSVIYKGHNGIISGLNTIDLMVNNNTGRGGFDSIYVADQGVFLSNLDTIQKSDSTRDNFVANKSITTPLIDSDTIKFASGASLTNIPQNDILLWDSTNSKYVPFPTFQANSLYSSSDNPTNTTRLNWDGIFGASGFYKYGTGYGINATSTDNTNTAYFHANGGGDGVLAISTQGSAIRAKNYQVPTANNTNSIVNIERSSNATTFNLTGDIIEIIDAPTTTGIVSGSVITATIDGIERINLKPRTTRTGTAYYFDTDSTLTTGNVLALANNADTLFRVTNDSVTARTLAAKFRTIEATDTIILPDGTLLLGTDTSNTFIIDTVIVDNLIIGEGGTVITGDTTSKFVMENTPLDSVQIGDNIIRFNKSEGVYEFTTSRNGVVWQGALEDLVQIYNNTGQVITNGTPFYFNNSIGDSIAVMGIASSNTESALVFKGLVTGEIGINDWGYGCTRGKVRGIPTTGLSLTTPVYLSPDSSYTATRPDSESEVIVIGSCIKVDATDGIILVYPAIGLKRTKEIKDYSFASGTANGTFYKAGFYRANAASSTLTNAALTTTFGTANVPYSAHPFIVCGGAGTATGGVVGLRITGTSIDDSGNEITSDADTILTDITSVALNEYYEAKKFVGTVTYELITISGTPTTYSLTFNLGYAKYDDLENADYYITSIEAVGVAGANDAGFNIELMHHKTTGWIYSAGAFVAGDNTIANMNADITVKNNLATGQPFSWKRTGLNTFINGSINEGIVFRITTTANSAVQSMDIHLAVEKD